MKRVGRHTISREIASSGVLSTFEATDEDGRTVRLRVFDRAVVIGDVPMKRFEEELSRVAALRHPGIDRPLAWTARAPVHVSTLRTRGASLRDICEDPAIGRVAPAVAAGLGADVAEALQAAHSAGLVHAGVSIDSILLESDGRARVTDFGVMRCLSELASVSPQVMRGSIESLSPEQLDAPDTVGPHTDVFGVGLALYRAMTGKPAFDAPSALGMSIRLSMGKPTPIESHGIEMPDELKLIVMKMLSADPGARPPMDVVARTLEKIAGSWRDAVRSLAASASRASTESEADSTPEQELSPEAAPAPTTEPPRNEARSTAERQASQGSTGDLGADTVAPRSIAPPEATPLASFDSPFPTVVSHIASDWVSGDESQGDDASAPFELATRLEIALPPEEPVTDDYATLFELQSPTGPTDGSELDEDDVDGAPASRGDTSPWPATDDQGGSVPKTVILEAPRARTAGLARAVPRVEAPSPRSLPAEHAPASEDPPRSVASARAPEWAMWTAIALGAFALLVGTAALVVLITA